MNRREALCIPESFAIHKVTPLLSADRTNQSLGGFLLVKDEKSVIVGTLTDADVRRGKQLGIDENQNVTRIMNREFVRVLKNQSLTEMAESIIGQISKRNIQNDFPITYIPVLNVDGTLFEVLHIAELLAPLQTVNRQVVVFGQGFVGLTLSLALADLGEKVIGVEIDRNTIDEIKEKRNLIHEPGLEELLRKNYLTNYNIIQGGDELPKRSSVFETRVFIIAVGTPASPDLADMNSCISALDSIGADLKFGDLIIVRSTVPVGFSRKLADRIYEQHNLLAGRDYFFCYAPERTIEGNALIELEIIPQLIAGFSEDCSKRGAAFFSGLSNSTIIMESLESCELGKLSSNTFRDTIFAFSNELSLIAREWNLDINKMIECVNSGYSRNFIPQPSPGVGGPCLSKDSYMLNFSFSHSVIKSARRLNEDMPSEFSRVISQQIKRFGNRVLAIGLAFKGDPPTNDFRVSPSVEICQFLLADGVELYGLDLVDDFALEQLGIPRYRASEEIIYPGTIMILNNHRQNVFEACNIASRPRILEDPNENEISKIPLLIDPWNLFMREDARKFFQYKMTLSQFQDLGR